MLFGGGGFNTFDQCRIQYNTAGQYGGGVYIYLYSPVFTNTLITDNVVDMSDPDARGGGVYDASQSSSYYPQFINVTIANNTADYGGGYWRSSSASSQFTNCIIYHNAATSSPSLNSANSVTYSDIEGSYSGTGNNDSDPLFADTAAADYHLTWGSPCIDTGDPSSNYSNEPLPNGGRINMGAYGNTSEAMTTPPSYFGPVWYVSSSGSDTTGVGSSGTTISKSL